MKNEQDHRPQASSSSSRSSSKVPTVATKKGTSSSLAFKSTSNFSIESAEMKQKHDRNGDRTTNNHSRRSSSTSRGGKNRPSSSSTPTEKASTSLRNSKPADKSSPVAATSIASSSSMISTSKSHRQSSSSRKNENSSKVGEKSKVKGSTAQNNGSVVPSASSTKKETNNGGMNTKKKTMPKQATPSITKKNSTLSTSDASVTSISSSISSSTAVSVDDYISVDQERKAAHMSTKLDAVAEQLVASLSDRKKDAILELLMMQDGVDEDGNDDEILGRILPSTNVFNTQAKKKLQRSQTTRSEATTLTFSASEKQEQGPKKRPIIHDGSYYTATYMGILFFVIGYWFYQSITMSQKDGHWFRCGWFVFAPLFIGMAMFPFRIAIYNTLALFGSWRNVKRNSRYHSYFAPPKPEILPPVCVQMPVYKEDFAETIAPSLDNIELAMDFYRSQGGQAFMFVNDDGLQLLDEEKRAERVQFYNEHNIAYIARPPPSLLVRHGLFKKASNMNFCLNFALELAKVEEEHPEWSEMQALQHQLDSRDYPVLAGGPISKLNNVEYILLVDSDTRVPIACLHDTVGEFVEALDDEKDEDRDKVGFVQHATSVLRVDDNYWEDMLAHFTHLLYSVFIPMGTACGEPSPLVGHNATLNWKAVQQVSWFDDNVGYRKFWSESHVSEDFDLSLRLQSAGYIGRYAMYTGPDFQEGVSVTVHDEIKKLRKFSYGSGEMLFNPLSKWLCHGPISPLIWRYFRTSSIPLHARLNLLAYLITYVAMAYGILSMPLVFYLAVLDGIDMNLPTPWELMIGTFFIFAVVGSTNVILLALFFGHHSSFLISVVCEIRHLSLLAVFYMGVQWHVFTAFFTYMFGMKAEWGATVKELDDYALTLRTFLSEVVKTVRAYLTMYIFVFFMAAFFTYFFMFGPFDNVYWSGEALAPFVVFMAAHASMPVLFNPAAMTSLFESCCCSCRCFLGRQRAKNNPDQDADDGEPAKIKADTEDRLPDV